MKRTIFFLILFSTTIFGSIAKPFYPDKYEQSLPRIANVSTWPTNQRLPDLFKKYVDRIDIKVWNTTDVITIESSDHGLKVLDELREFYIPTYAEDLKREEEVQNKYRLATTEN